jgi:hypothetical protein
MLPKKWIADRKSALMLRGASPGKGTEREGKTPAWLHQIPPNLPHKLMR